MTDKNSPSWFAAEAEMMFQKKYLYDAKTPREQYERIARTIARHYPDPEFMADKFFTMFWEGIYSLSTPSLGNTGTDRGYPIACSGGVVEDSIAGFSEAWKESALLTQGGAGTSYYLGDIRSRGSSVSKGGFADGAAVQFKNLRRISQEISQGGLRRGSVGLYYPIDGPDFWEIWNFVKKYPDDSNIGWCVSDEFIINMQQGHQESNKRYQHVVLLRVMLGRGYIFFTDKVNRARPESLKMHGLMVRASNLCSETCLPANERYTFSCVLGALNLMHWDRIKKEGWIKYAIMFLDGLVTEYIQLADGKPGMDKIVAFTEDFRALGLGVMGLHSLFQYRGLTFSSMEAHLLNGEIFKNIQEESRLASLDLGRQFGEAPIMHGTGLRNSHRTAMMPTMSTAIIMGGYSEGIGPMVMNVFTKDGAIGEIEAINPWFMELLESKALGFDKNAEIIKDVGERDGSFQHRPEFTDEEKKIGLTAFELSQESILRLASARQKYICQSQSLNLYFSQHENPNYISKIHMMAFLDEGIQTLYYTRSSDKTAAHGGNNCESCQ